MNIKNLLATKDEGFSLVEMMLAAGVIGALSLGFIKLMETSNKTAKTIETKDEISMLTKEIVSILSNPESCFHTLGGKSVSPDNVPNVPSIFRMAYSTGEGSGSGSGYEYGSSQATPVAVPKLTAQPDLIKSPTLFIKGMRVKTIELNGQGDRALATLEVTFFKPNNTMGGPTIKKEITLNANTCNLQESDGTHTSPTQVKTWCSDLSGKLIEGPIQSNLSTNPPRFYGTCQICNSSTQAAKIIRACQSTGSSSEVDLSSIDEMTCANLGGSYESPSCVFGDPPLPLDEHIVREAALSLPQCIMVPGSTCPPAPAAHTDASGSPQLISTTSQSTITMYNISCTGQYARRNTPACIANYSAYAHTTQTCTTTSSTTSGSCSLPNSINGCTFCNGDCFNKTSQSCAVTSQFQQNQTNTGSITMIQCCRP